MLVLSLGGLDFQGFEAFEKKSPDSFLASLTDSWAFGPLEGFYDLSLEPLVASAATGVLPHLHGFLHREQVTAGGAVVCHTVASQRHPFFWQQVDAAGGSCLVAGWPFTHGSQLAHGTVMGDTFANHQFPPDPSSVHPAEVWEEAVAEFIGPEDIPTATLAEALDVPLASLSEYADWLSPLSHHLADMTNRQSAILRDLETNRDLRAVHYSIPSNLPQKFRDALLRAWDECLRVTVSRCPEEDVLAFGLAQANGRFTQGWIAARSSMLDGDSALQGLTWEHLTPAILAGFGIASPTPAPVLFPKKSTIPPVAVLQPGTEPIQPPVSFDERRVRLFSRLDCLPVIDNAAARESVQRETTFTLALSHLAAGEHAEALEALLTLNYRYPEDVALRLQTVRILLQADMQAEALDQLEYAQALQPDNPLLKALRAGCLAELHRVDEGGALLASLEIEKISHEETLLQIAQAAEYLHHWPDALTAATIVYESNGDHAGAAFFLARALAGLRKLDEAKAWAEHAVALRVSPRHYYLLGMICQANKEPQAAQSAFEQALRINPKFYKAAFALQRLKRPERSLTPALRQWEALREARSRHQASLRTVLSRQASPSFHTTAFPGPLRPVAPPAVIHGFVGLPSPARDAWLNQVEASLESPLERDATAVCEHLIHGPAAPQGETMVLIPTQLTLALPTQHSYQLTHFAEPLESILPHYRSLAKTDEEINRALPQDDAAALHLLRLQAAALENALRKSHIRSATVCRSHGTTPITASPS